jgi:hypothetical protein
MKKEETKLLLAKIQTIYPLAYSHQDDEMLQLTLDTWHAFLQDLDVRLVFAVVGKIVTTKNTGYPPTIAGILEEYQRALNPSAFVSPETAWITVRQAITKFGYYRETEALASFSAATHKAVKTIGWQNLCRANDVQFDFMRKNFVEAYKQVEYDDRHALLNPNAHEQLMQIVKNIKLPEELKKLSNEQKDELM